MDSCAGAAGGGTAYYKFQAAMLAFAASWPLLFAAGALAQPPLNLALLGDWGGSPLWPDYTTGPQLQCAAALSAYAASSPVTALLALGDNFYNLGICSNHTLAPYNSSCPNTTDPRVGTAEDPRFIAGFERAYASPPLHSFPWYIIAGNHDALGNVSASIAYSALSPGGRWRHPSLYYSLAFAASAAESVQVLMIDTTICYGIWSDAEHAAACAAQLSWLEA